LEHNRIAQLESLIFFNSAFFTARAKRNWKVRRKRSTSDSKKSH